MLTAFTTATLLFGACSMITTTTAHNAQPHRRRIRQDGTNDKCTNSTIIPSLPYQITGTTKTTTSSTNDTSNVDINSNYPSCGVSNDSHANGVWYSYTPSTTKELTALINAGMGIRVYSGEDCEDLTCVMPSDIMTTFVGVQNVQYRFLISSPGTSFFDFVFNVKEEDVTTTTTTTATAATTTTTSSSTTQISTTDTEQTVSSSSPTVSATPTMKSSPSPSESTTISPTMKTSQALGLMETQRDPSLRQNTLTPTYAPMVPSANANGGDDMSIGSKAGKASTTPINNMSMDDEDDCPEEDDDDDEDDGNSMSIQNKSSKSSKSSKVFKAKKDISMSSTMSKSEKYGSISMSIIMFKSEKISRSSKSSKKSKSSKNTKCVGARGKSSKGKSSKVLGGKTGKGDSYGTSAQFASQFDGARAIMSSSARLQSSGVVGGGLFLASWMIMGFGCGR